MMSTDAQNDSLFTRFHRSWFGFGLVGSYAPGAGGADERRDEADQQPVHRPFVRDDDRLLDDRAVLRPDRRAPAAGLIAAGHGRGAGASAVGAAVANPACVDRIYGDRLGFDQR